MALVRFAGYKSVWKSFFFGQDFAQGEGGVRAGACFRCWTRIRICFGCCCISLARLPIPKLKKMNFFESFHAAVGGGAGKENGVHICLLAESLLILSVFVSVIHSARSEILRIGVLEVLTTNMIAFCTKMSILLRRSHQILKLHCSQDKIWRNHYSRCYRSELLIFWSAPSATLVCQFQV